LREQLQAAGAISAAARREGNGHSIDAQIDTFRVTILYPGDPVAVFCYALPGRCNFDRTGSRPVRASKQIHKTVLTATVAMGLMLGASATATDQGEPVGAFNAEERRTIEEIAHDYILNHPEIIVEALQRFRLQQEQAAEQKRRESAGAVRPVDSKDHIRGNPDAPVKLVEFSDFECPFCKGFHATVKQLMDEYGKDGRVAWIYRHFPIDSLHSKARKEAQAAECANELGGNDAFWAYSDKLFEITPSNDRLDLSLLPQIAEEIGLDRAKFEACLAGDTRGAKFADRIESDARNASASGGTGTPYTIVIAPGGKTFPINGAQSYSTVKSVIDLALKEQYCATAPSAETGVQQSFAITAQSTASAGPAVPAARTFLRA
jgi:protein-disulfide isomerase